MRQRVQPTAAALKARAGRRNPDSAISGTSALIGDVREPQHQAKLEYGTVDGRASCQRRQLACFGIFRTSAPGRFTPKALSTRS